MTPGITNVNLSFQIIDYFGQNFNNNNGSYAILYLQNFKDFSTDFDSSFGIDGMVSTTVINGKINKNNLYVFLIGMFAYSNIKIKGKLSSQVILAIELDILTSIKIPQLYKQYPNERIDYSLLNYYYYIPLRLQNVCDAGQYYDLTKYDL